MPRNLTLDEARSGKFKASSLITSLGSDLSWDGRSSRSRASRGMGVQQGGNCKTTSLATHLTVVIVYSMIPMIPLYFAPKNHRYIGYHWVTWEYIIFINHCLSRNVGLTVHLVHLTKERNRKKRPKPAVCKIALPQRRSKVLLGKQLRAEASNQLRFPLIR